MKTITITNTFINAVGGNAAAQILGPHTNINYSFVGSDQRSLSLPFGLFSIKIIGSSGGTLNLSVDDAAKNLLTDTCTGPFISIINGFLV